MNKYIHFIVLTIIVVGFTVLASFINIYFENFTLAKIVAAFGGFVFFVVYNFISEDKTHSCEIDKIGIKQT